jgi:hypothetical protein
MSKEVNDFGSLLVASESERQQAFGATRGKPVTTDQIWKARERSHAELTKLNFVRSRCEELLDGKSLTLVLGSSEGLTGSDGKSYWIKIDPPIGLTPEDDIDFARLPEARKPFSLVRLMSEDNKKMTCPSFALPAGAPSVGGTCTGAAIGQEVVDDAAYDRAVAAVPKTKLHVISSKKVSICSACYAATTTNAQYSSLQLEETTRLLWVKGVLKAAGAKGLTEELSLGIQGLKNGRWHKYAAQGEKDYGLKFFRLHDSGDFLTTRYADAWIAVAKAHPDVQFWAPTRTWVVEEWEKYWAKTEVPSNMLIRPSAYNFDDPAPYTPGLGPGSTSLYAKTLPDGSHVANEDESLASWNCRVYYIKNRELAGACINAESPDENGKPSGKLHCRACWTRPDLTINYTAHGWFLLFLPLLGLFA